jgi:general secretion pathway protein H
LLELLLVLVIVGVMLGAIALNAAPSQRQMLQSEAQRIAQLMQLARDEAIVRNREIAFESDDRHYRFLMRDGTGWRVITDDELLRERNYRISPLSLRLDPSSPSNRGVLRIVFGREPVDEAFTLIFSTENVWSTVRADGVGHFLVE